MPTLLIEAGFRVHFFSGDWNEPPHVHVDAKGTRAKIWLSDLHDLHVRLADGRQVSTPLWWYPRLLDATPAQRNNVRLMLDGVHWPDVDEDLSVDGMLQGRKAPGAKPPSLAAE